MKGLPGSFGTKPGLSSIGAAEPCVLVMSSPNLHSLSQPQRGHALNAAITTRSRATCASKGLRAGRSCLNGAALNFAAAAAPAVREGWRCVLILVPLPRDIAEQHGSPNILGHP